LLAAASAASSAARALRRAGDEQRRERTEGNGGGPDNHGRGEAGDEAGLKEKSHQRFQEAPDDWNARVDAFWREVEAAA
jgi:hypothetical protein